MRPHGSGAEVLGGGPLRLTLHTLIYEAAVADPSHLDVVLVADIFLLPQLRVLHTHSLLRFWAYF